jgi:hypothetical protein
MISSPRLIIDKLSTANLSGLSYADANILLMLPTNKIGTVSGNFVFINTG